MGSYYHQTNQVSCGKGKHSPTKLDKNSKMAQNINVRMPPFLPTVPLPVGMVGQGMMYMYSCSQCDFKTHVEAMFKQHVDSVHLGIPRYEIQR